MLHALDGNEWSDYPKGAGRREKGNRQLANRYSSTFCVSYSLASPTIAAPRLLFYAEQNQLSGKKAVTHDNLSCVSVIFPPILKIPSSSRYIYREEL